MGKPHENEFEIVGHYVINLVTTDNDFDVAIYVDCVRWCAMLYFPINFYQMP